MLCCLFAWSLQAQTTISGKVTDAATNEPLIGASIFVKNTAVGVLTDIDGTYIIKVPSGATTLLVTYTGYKNQDVPLGGGEVIDIALEQGVELDVIVVSASRKEETLQESPAAVSVIEAPKIKSDLTANPFSLLRNTTGVDVGQFGVSDGQITLRGRNTVFATETFIISDYRNILLPSFGAIQFGQQPIDAIDLERVEVVKGPSGALYGPGVESGVVHFISKSPFKEQGTTISVGGGNQSQLQAALRHAGVVADGKLGYKITAFYRSAEEFQVDTTEAAARERLAAYPDQVVSAVDGSFVADGALDYNVLNYGITGTLEYKFDPNTSLTAIAGFGKSEGIFRSGQGEGYTKAGRPFAQLRFQSSDLSAQVFWSKQQGSDGESWLYTNGLTAINEIDQLEGQLQYRFSLANSKLNFTVGTDYRANIIDTRETVNGRFEDSDDYAIYGAYLQGQYNVTDQFNIIAATRVDQFTALDETSVSPRVALVYKPAQDNSIRLTWNRATGAPLSLNLHSDFPTSDLGLFQVYLNGGAEPLTYDDGGMFSFITQSRLPSLAFPLNIAYGAATQGIGASGQLPAPLIAYLTSELPNIAGTTAGVPTFTPLSRGRLVPSQTDMYEIGYKGVINNKFSIGIDLFYIQRNNSVTGTTVASPFVVYPTAGADLANAVAGTLNADSLAQFGLTPQIVAGIYQGALETLTTDANGSPSPLGVISADQSITGTTLDVTFFNLEEIDYYGLDLDLRYLITSDLSVFTNFSWLSDTYWSDAVISGADGLTTEFALNQTDTKFRIGVDYLPTKGFNGSVTYRYNGEYETRNGRAWAGTVEAVSMVDLSAGYTFDMGLSLNATVTNLFNADYRPIANAPIVGRLFLAKATYQF